MKPTLEQEQMLSRLKQKTHQRVEVLAHLEAEYERRIRDRTEDLERDQLKMIQQLVKMGTPQRRIGAAIGIANHYLLKEWLSRASVIDEEPDVAEPLTGRVEVTKNDDKLTVLLVEWAEWPLDPARDGKEVSNAVDFVNVDDAWMPAKADPLSLAVERELFTDGGSEGMKAAFASA